MAKKVRNRAAQDITLINLRAVNKALAQLEARLTRKFSRELKALADRLYRARL